MAPLAATLLRYGACAITLERCLFSKITTTIWSGRGTAARRFFGVGRRTAAVGMSGTGSATALVDVGSAATIVGGKPLEGAGAAPEDGSATAHAADASSNIPVAAQLDRGKARTWNPYRSKQSQTTIERMACLPGQRAAPRARILITQCSKRDTGRVDKSHACVAASCLLDDQHGDA